MEKERVSRKEKKEITRTQLVEGASSLFAKQGIAETTTAQIAEHCKVSHGTVFVHFPTREDLILAVIDRYGASLSVEFANCFKEHDLPAVLSAHLDVLAQYEDFYFRLLSELHQLPPAVQSVAFMLNAAVSWSLFEAAKPEIKSGRVKRLTRPDLFNTWMALVHYQIVNRHIFSAQTPILKEQKNQLIQRFMLLIQN